MDTCARSRRRQSSFVRIKEGVNNRVDVEQGLMLNRVDVEQGLMLNRVDVEQGLMLNRVDVEQGLMLNRVDVNKVDVNTLITPPSRRGGRADPANVTATLDSARPGRSHTIATMHMTSPAAPCLR